MTRTIAHARRRTALPSTGASLNHAEGTFQRQELNNGSERAAGAMVLSRME